MGGSEDTNRGQQLKLLLQTYRSFFVQLFRPHLPWNEIFRQFVIITDTTLFTILLGSIVQGLFIAWIQGWYGTWWGATMYVGAGTVQVVLLETAVLMSGILYACKAGTGFTVAINSMNISGQLDALRMMDVDPVQYLVVPRVLTSTVILPIFVSISSLAAIGSTFLFLFWWFGIPWAVFMDSALRFVDTRLVSRALLRAAVIGFAVAANASAFGLAYSRGAEDMGHITTRSVVLNVFTVFLIDLAIGVTFILGGRFSP